MSIGDPPSRAAWWSPVVLHCFCVVIFSAVRSLSRLFFGFSPAMSQGKTPVSHSPSHSGQEWVAAESPDKILFPPRDHTLLPFSQALAGSRSSGFPETLYGFVVEHSKEKAHGRWVRIFAPLRGESYFSNRLELWNLFPKFSPTPVCFSASQTPIRADGFSVRGTSGVRAVDTDLLHRANNTLAQQCWGRATIFSINHVSQRITLSIPTGRGSQTFRFECSNAKLHRSSQHLPAGSPVRFQTVFWPPQKKGERGKVGLSAIIYDEDRANDHLSVLPSSSHIRIASLNATNPVPLILGGSSAIDVRSVSLPEILRFDSDLRRSDISSLIEHAKTVLIERLGSLDKEREPENFQTLQLSITSLEEKTPFDIYIIPTFYNLNTWMQMTSRFHARRGDASSPPVEGIHLLCQVDHTISPKNVETCTGLSLRHVEQWNSKDCIVEYSISAGLGPFSRVFDNIVNSDVTQTVADAKGSEDDQLLVVKTAPPRTADRRRS